MSFFKNLLKVNKPKTVLLPDGTKEVHLPKGFEFGGLQYRLVNEYKDDQPIRSTAFNKDNTPYIDYKKDDYISIRLEKMTVVKDKRNTSSISHYTLIHDNDSEITMSIELVDIDAEQLSKNSKLFPVTFVFSCLADGKQLSLDLAKDIVIAYFSNEIWGYESRFNFPLNERKIFFQRITDRDWHHIIIDGVKFELLYEPGAALELI
jgi:hypothetical protein